MNAAYSSVVSVSIEGRTTHEQLTHTYESHIERHGSSPSLQQLFETARDAASSDQDRAVISWLETAIAKESGRDSDSDDEAPSTPPHHYLISHLKEHHDEHHKAKNGIFISPIFFPSEESYGNFIKTLSNAKKSLDICVFTITDNDTANAVIQAHERGVRVRIISDDDKAEDLGADVKRFARDNDIPTRVDGSPSHMHHKFAIIDDALVMTGSYNWTKGARYQNREDLCLTNSTKAVRAFKDEFEKLWDLFEEFQL
ncbi:hypothetical protein KI688_008388 [Linnemannia hyalina]|uniref:Mitochondrial cardiolipin hydrolase n=1 Tax=Linnemannia hyalina TaxID=64524 RepID=A0A9P7Y160_9FUNG|nr:hypothetical protein KI688_008388 [Linnemannia hyalina]